MVHRVKHCKVKSIYIKIYPLSLERQAQLFLCATCIIFCLLTNDEMKTCQRQLFVVDSTYQNLRTHQKGNNEYVFVLSLGFSMRYP